MTLHAGEVSWECPVGFSLVIVPLMPPQRRLSSHMGCPAHPSGRWPYYAARQAGMKEPMLLKRGDGRFTFPEDWSGPLVWLVTCSHPISRPPKGTLAAALSMAGSDQPSGNVNLLSPTATGSPRGLLCCASCSFHRYHLKMTPQVLSVPYSRFFWESISAGNAVQSFQLPYGWTKLALFSRIWRNTTDFTSWKLLLYQSRSNSLSYEIHRHLSRHPCFFHVFIRRAFS